MVAGSGDAAPVTGLNLPAKDNLRFVLLGAGHHMCALARMLAERGFPRPVIVTYPRADHERDRALLTDPRIYADVFEIARELDLEIIEAATVNKPQVIDHLVELGVNAAFSLSCRSIIKSGFLDAFEGRVFNIHPTLLPEERGGGTFSWRIMNRRHEISATIHLIDDGIDTGDIVLQKRIPLDLERPGPADFMIGTNRLYAELLETFLDTAENGNDFALAKQDGDHATYLPRLHTETNAAIDWSWPAADIEVFIRAFSDPYPGAFTFMADKRLVILEADFEESSIRYHPYGAGRVLSHHSDGSVTVIAGGGGLVRLRRISLGGEARVPAETIGVTGIMYTPRDVLDRAARAVVPVGRMTKAECRPL